MTRRLAVLLLAAWAAASIVQAQVPHPSEAFGFHPGDDYKLADYDQLTDYYRRLDAASDRIRMQEIGKSVRGRPMYLLFISSRENLEQLDRWRDISRRLARARISQDEARELSRQGKAIIWIDAGLHATERAPSQMAPLLAHRVATDESEDMKRVRRDSILLLMPCMNPDGLDIIVDWYRKNLGTPYETTRPPELYHHYVGHDNNRDWFMNNMPESEAVTRVLYQQWYPQIVFNHHQTAPAWARIFLPPFADPVNPNIPPGVTTGVNLVGSAMANHFAMRKMPGVVSDVIYSMWWNGGMRTVPYFHNMIGILTETAHATPTPRFYDPEKRPKAIANRRGSGMLSNGTNIFYPYPWQGGMSHFRDAVEYTLEASLAVLNIGTQLRENWLYGIYQMGRESIERGEKGGPYAYVIPARQHDSGEAAELINVLLIGGVEVHRASAAFQAGGTSYQAGDYVLPASQPFRPYLVDLLEKQQYPDRRLTPEGPPQPPYDLAGWTLPMQMGVRVDRHDDPFQLPRSEPVAGPAGPPSGRISGQGSFGYVLSRNQNNAVLAANRLLSAGERLHWTDGSWSDGERRYGAGTIVIESKSGTRQRVSQVARELGLELAALSSKPQVQMSPMRRSRVGLYKSWVANMDEGWTRWLLEQYEFDLVSLTDADVRDGGLSGLDAVILPHQSAQSILSGHSAGTMPSQYTGGLRLEGALELKRFVEQGGVLLAFDAASDFAIEQFGLPLRNAVAGASSNRFFIPGSLIRMGIDLDHPLSAGMQSEAAASFVRSRAFNVVKLSRRGEGGQESTAQAPEPPIEVIARYASDDLLMSGWAMGEKRAIGGKPSALRVPVGQGSVVLFAFRPQFRGQPRGTYKLVFNALLQAAVDQAAQTTGGGD